MHFFYLGQFILQWLRKFFVTSVLGNILQFFSFTRYLTVGFKNEVQVQVRFIICRLDAIKDTLYIKIICNSKTKITFCTTGDWKGPVTVI